LLFLVISPPAASALAATTATSLVVVLVRMCARFTGQMPLASTSAGASSITQRSVAIVA